MKKILITGGAGFLGAHLLRSLMEAGVHDIVVFDKLALDTSGGAYHKIQSVKGDILSLPDVRRLFSQFGPFDTVYHLAAAMPNKADSDAMTWRINVEGTVNVASTAAAQNTRSFIFTSSNVTYGVPAQLPVTEKTPTQPIEVYGKSKKEAEVALAKYSSAMSVQIFRCPVIVGEGRLGLQSILYEFISENRNVYVLGGGKNRYQFVDARDVVSALAGASVRKGFDIYVIGADDVVTLRELFEGLIRAVGSTSRVISLPKIPSLAALYLLDKIGISPLGPYQYTMISRSLYADTAKLKRAGGWKPQKTNLESFIENYEWYFAHKHTFQVIGKSNASSNRSLPKMGILKLLKFFS